MNAPHRLAINGAHGRMGQQLCALAAADARFELVATCTSATDFAALPAFEVMVDFSAPAGLARALDHCERHGVALVSGTTGLDPDLQQRLDAVARSIALLHAANFSLGVALLAQLVAHAAAALPHWDLEILEAHHSAKRDAPSGTALALGQAAASARGVDFDAVKAIDRRGERVPGSIGFGVLRAGDIVGEHTMLLATRGERIELSHRATDRAIFARGALHAAAWLAGRGAGRYTIGDVLAV